MRNAILRMAMLCALGACAVMAARPAMAKPSAEDDVLAAEQAREDALTQNDFAALDKIIADDAIYCHASGRVDSKSAFLDTLKAGRNRYVKIDRTDPHVYISGNIGVIHASLALTVHPQGADQRVENVFATIVYEKRAGKWVMISSQSTRKPEPPANGAPVSPAAAPAK